MATPQYDDEVQITLAVCGPPGNLLFRERRLFLCADSPIVPIGRTSKRDSTFEQGRNNAWVDAAVMSRNHAQLEFDAVTKKVYITDKGSLHGTFHNGDKLDPEMPKPLAHGDVLRFGTFVERNAQSFPPCIVNISLKRGTEFRPEGKPAVFKVPDESDDEDDDIDDEDASIQNSAAALLQHGFRPLIPSGTSPEVIDLVDARPGTSNGTADQNDVSTTHEPVEQVDGGGAVRTPVCKDAHAATSQHCATPPTQQPREPGAAAGDVIDGIDLTSELEDEDEEFHWQGELGHDADADASSLVQDNDSLSTDAPAGDDLALTGSSSPPAEQAPEPLPGEETQDSDDGSEAPGSLHCTPTRTVRLSDVVAEKPAVDQLGKSAPVNGPTAPLGPAQLPCLSPDVRDDHDESAAPSSRANTRHLMSPQTGSRPRSMVGSTLYQPLPQPWGSGVEETLDDEGGDDDHEDTPKFFSPAFAVASATKCDDCPTSDLLASGAKFLTTPPLDDQLPQCDGSAPPPLDDTSAYRFGLSKNAADEDAPVSLPNDEEARVSLLKDEEARVSLLKDEESKGQVTGRKRKAGSISSSTMDEDRTGGGSVKRIRKAAEVLGYVALGGVAVMSALIATAPNL